MVAKTLLMAFGLLSWHAHASELLTNFDQITQELKAGEQVRVITDFSKCQPAVRAGGVAGISEAFLQALQITFSNSALVPAANQTLVTNYVQYDIYSNGTATVLSKVIDPRTFASLSYETFACKMNQGDDAGGMSFYVLKGSH